MISDKPWYSSAFSESLSEKHFSVSVEEINNIITHYNKVIDFHSMKYNYNEISNMNLFVDFMEFDYGNELIIETYIKCFIDNYQGALYAVPIFFIESEFHSILYDFKPSLLAKIASCFEEYSLCYKSLIADYRGEFIIWYDDLSSFMITKNGHFCLRAMNTTALMSLNNWTKLSNNELEMYDYDLDILHNFQKVLHKVGGIPQSMLSIN